MEVDVPAAAELGAIVRINGARCVEHGSVRPEGARFPFSASADMLAIVSPSCLARGCESAVVLDAEPVAVPLPNHLELFDGRPVWRVSPVNGRYELGVVAREELLALVRRR